MAAVVFTLSAAMAADTVRDNFTNAIGLYDNTIREAELLSEEMSLDGSMGAWIAVMLLMTVICTAIALCVVYKMAQIEGRQEQFENILKGEKQGYKLLTVPAIVAFVLAAAFMGYVEYASRVLS